MAIKGKEVALYLSGQSVPIIECNIVLYQPTIKEIVIFGEDDFLSLCAMFGQTEKFLKDAKKGNPELENYSNLQILLAIIMQDMRLFASCQQFFELLFPIYEPIFSENDIQFKLKNEEKYVGALTPFNFEIFGEKLKDLFLIPSAQDEIEYNPEGEKAIKIAEKIMEGRKKLAEIKSSSDGNNSLFGSYISILSIGIPMDMNVLYGYTPFQIYNLFTRYWAKVQSDFYQKIATTPMMDVSKMKAPEEWTRNLY